MNKQGYIKSLKKESNELYAQIEILEEFKDFLEKQLRDYEDEIKEKENRIEEINAELDELEDNTWGNNQESERTWMGDVIPPQYL